MKHVLVVDDEKHVREFLREVLESENYDVLEADSVESANECLHERAPGLVLLDLMLPDGNGLEVLHEANSLSPAPTVVVITAVGTISAAVDSIRKGAFDFITKPFDVETIQIAVERAFGYATIARENKALRRQRDNRAHYEEFIGNSPEVKRIKDLILRLSHTDVPVLITGETGTGKSVLAKQIHYTWSPADAPLVHANCASIPEHLFESELFGHEKGAFTGATSAKHGLAEAANGGTLILDEISEMPLSLQAKLLHLLQEREFCPVGATRPRRFTARLLALTNRDLQAESDAGRFRSDLFYRLNVVHLEIPPLRERGEDVLLFAQHFLTKLQYKYDQPHKHLSSDCRNYIVQCSWPGNVRELKNNLERAFILSDSEYIAAKDLGGHNGVSHQSSGDLRARVAEFERRLIEEALSRHNGNKTQAAAELGISVRNLHYKLSH